MEWTEAGKSKILVHFARHMEEISLAALPRDVESEHGSDEDIDTASRTSSELEDTPRVLPLITKNCQFHCIKDNQWHNARISVSEPHKSEDIGLVKVVYGVDRYNVKHPIPPPETHNIPITHDMVIGGSGSRLTVSIEGRPYMLMSFSDLGDREAIVACIKRLRTSSRTTAQVEQLAPQYAAPDSYWSVEEQRSFSDYIARYGKDWSTIADKMGTKTSDMVEAQYVRHVEAGHAELEQLAQDAAARRVFPEPLTDSEGSHVNKIQSAQGDWVLTREMIPDGYSLAQQVSQQSLEANSLDSSLGVEPQVINNTRPWKCSEQPRVYFDLGWSTEREPDRHINDKHSATPGQYKCLYPPCTYASKRESNCKQHMERAHRWEYVRSKSNGKKKATTTKNSTIATDRSQPERTTFEGTRRDKYIIKCICGSSSDDGNTVLCEGCDSWQHIACYYGHIPDKHHQHHCDDCNPRFIYRAPAAENRSSRVEAMATEATKADTDIAKLEPEHHYPEPKQKTVDTMPDLAQKMRKRSKTGCLTCRKRRIVCKEERPTCSNCTKAAFLCEGYNQRVIFRTPDDELQLFDVTDQKTHFQPTDDDIQKLRTDLLSPHQQPRKQSTANMRINTLLHDDVSSFLQNQSLSGPPRESWQSLQQVTPANTWFQPFTQAADLVENASLQQFVMAQPAHVLGVNQGYGTRESPEQQQRPSPWKPDDSVYLRLKSGKTAGPFYIVQCHAPQNSMEQWRYDIKDGTGNTESNISESIIERVQALGTPLPNNVIPSVISSSAASESPMSPHMKSGWMASNEQETESRPTLRPLLPETRYNRNRRSQEELQSGYTVPTTGPKRLRASCDACSRNKVKCSKERPTCSRCVHRGAVCNYSPSIRLGKPRVSAQEMLRFDSTPPDMGFVKTRASCDTCSRSKVKCSKERPACSRCNVMGIGCNYSPSIRSEKGGNSYRKLEEPSVRSMDTLPLSNYDIYAISGSDQRPGNDIPATTMAPPRAPTEDHKDDTAMLERMQARLPDELLNTKTARSDPRNRGFTERLRDNQEQQHQQQAAAQDFLRRDEQRREMQIRHQQIRDEIMKGSLRK